MPLSRTSVPSLSASKISWSEIRSALGKVPEITLIFWLTKILTTAFGESVSDFVIRGSMAHHISPVFAVALGALGLAVTLALQVRARRCHSWLYWLAVTWVAVFGTMAADVLHVGLGVPYRYSTAFFAFSLLAIFGFWYAVERTLDIHSIQTVRRELFYWATVLATFALGTAAGDWTAISLHWGYEWAGTLFLSALLVVGAVHLLLVLVHRRQGHREPLDTVPSFWLAYILTRPLGASFADWFGKPRSWGGQGGGDGNVSLVLGVLILVFVALQQGRKFTGRQKSV